MLLSVVKTVPHSCHTTKLTRFRGPRKYRSRSASVDNLQSTCTHTGVGGQEHHNYGITNAEQHRLNSDGIIKNTPHEKTSKHKLGMELERVGATRRMCRQLARFSRLRYGSS